MRERFIESEKDRNTEGYKERRKLGWRKMEDLKKD
jgi:hypothetical protein